MSQVHFSYLIDSQSTLKGIIAQLLVEKAQTYSDQVTWSGHSYKVGSDSTRVFAYPWTFQIT